MAKKLEIELALKNEKAKRKAREVGEAAADGMDKAANASERLERNLEKSSDALRLSSKQLVSVAASMGGMLLGTAAKAAAAYLPQNSSEQKALDWGGSITQGAGAGAAMGSLFGPLGTALGGLVGAINALVGKFTDEKTKANAEAEALKQQNEANRELAETLFAAQERTKAFRKTIDNLGDSERPLADRQRELAEEIRRRTEEEARLKTGLKYNSGRDADKADQKLFAQQVKDYQANHAELERLQALQKSLANEKQKDPAAAFRESMTAVDALSRVGGSFAGGGDLARDQLRVANDQLTVLKSIDMKTSKTGGSVWQ
jgi:uncharacterized damage-inducible protein DinB